METRIATLEERVLKIEETLMRMDSSLRGDLESGEPGALSILHSMSETQRRNADKIDRLLSERNRFIGVLVGASAASSAIVSFITWILHEWIR